jgi:hypothetical protein
MARRSLDAMADGGIHDQLGGGFHRYATDAIWLVPHFEQMLYDNAQLARVYLHAWALTGDQRYEDVTRAVLGYMRRELTTDDGAFAASQDADTEGIEGLTFTWTAAEIGELLGPDAALFEAAYGVTDGGNWEGRSILTRAAEPDELATRFGLDVPEVIARLATAERKLVDRRASRPQPARDDKALAAWNGLAIAAFAEAGRLFADPGYVAAGVRAAETIVGGLLAEDGRLMRSWKDGRAVGNGVLEDYANLADGLLALYEATFDERWFTIARALMDRVLDRFADPAAGFFDTADDHERLVTRPKDVQDNAVPSGNAMAATVLLRLAAWTGEGRYRDAAERAIRAVAPLAGRHPTAFAQWLVAIDMALADALEIAVVGAADEPSTAALLEPVARGYRPNQVLAAAPDPDASSVPLLHGRQRIDGRPTAYLCRGFACRLPVTDPDALLAQLAEPPDAA